MSNIEAVSFVLNQAFSKLSLDTLRFLVINPLFDLDYFRNLEEKLTLENNYPPMAFFANKNIIVIDNLDDLPKKDE